MTVLFFLMDVIPDYIQKTFGVDEEGHIQSVLHLIPSPALIQTVREGGTIPDDIREAIIIYNSSLYHYQQLTELTKQIRAINPNATYVTIPVQG